MKFTFLKRSKDLSIKPTEEDTRTNVQKIMDKIDARLGDSTDGKYFNGKINVYRKYHKGGYIPSAFSYSVFAGWDKVFSAYISQESHDAKTIDLKTDRVDYIQGRWEDQL